MVAKGYNEFTLFLFYRKSIIIETWNCTVLRDVTAVTMKSKTKYNISHVYSDYVTGCNIDHRERLSMASKIVRCRV